MLPSFTIMGTSDHENVAKNSWFYNNNKDKNNTIYSLVTQLDEICTQACSWITRI
jgi:hypothetical protein